MQEPLSEILGRLGMDLLALLGYVLRLLLRWSPLIAWIVWWLWGVNWRKAWPVLIQGAWVPVVLLIFLVALAWSQMVPGQHAFMGMTLPNFLWQVGAVSLLAAIALFCGWLQGVLGWQPQDIDLEPPAAPAHEHH